MQGLGVPFFKNMTHLVCLSIFRQRDNYWHMKIITIEFLVTNHLLFALNTYTVHEDTNVT